MLALLLIDMHASSNLLPLTTDVDRRNHGFVLFVFLIVALLHVLMLSALRDGLRANVTAARPTAVPLTVRMISADTLPMSAVPTEEKTSSTSAYSTQHAKEMRSQKTVRQAVRPHAKEQAISTAAVRQDLAANTEPPRDANTQTSQTSGPNVDWEGDLKRFGPGRITRYEKASPFNSPNADTPSQAPANALTRGVREAARGDCRKAHARAGLLALPMLALGAVSDSGCKW
jgi:hypothetical protein